MLALTVILALSSAAAAEMNRGVQVIGGEEAEAQTVSLDDVKLNLEVVIDDQGHYVFGCTLPNAVVNSKQSLRMEIAINGHEVTYHIRK